MEGECPAWAANLHVLDNIAPFFNCVEFEVHRLVLLERGFLRDELYR